jgi:anaerobic selenocysteine-containing dehydrogenase
MSVLIERLMTAVGSPNYLRPASIEDTYRMGNAFMQGNENPIAYDLENSDYVLSFGCGLLEGWGAPGRVMNAWGLWHEENPGKRKCKIVQIESRASNTASKADYWVAPKPGTDGALALGIAHVLIKKGLYDRKFVEQNCFGFEDWSSPSGAKKHMGFKTMVLKKYSPSSVSKITGVDEKTIISLAEKFARAKAPVAIYGKGKDTLNGSVYEFMAVQSLNALLGSMNRPGGVLLPGPLPLSPLPAFDTDGIANKGLASQRLDAAGTTQYPFTHSLLNNFSEAITQAPASPIDTLLVFSANPVFTQPDGGSFLEALKKIPFIVSFSPYRDETAVMADLILPDHNYLEKIDDVVWPVGLQYPLYGISSPVVIPVKNTMNAGDAVIELSKAIDESVASAFPWGNFEEVLMARMQGLFDAGGGLAKFSDSDPAWKWKKPGAGSKGGFKSFDKMWKAVTSGGMWYRPVAGTGKPSFSTPSRKFEFFSKKIELALDDFAKKAPGKTSTKEMGIDVSADEACMGHYSAMAPDGDRSEYPLTMVPYEMMNLASGWIPNPPFLYKTLFEDQLLKDISFAAINPETAAQYGLKQGDHVLVKSTAGEAKVGVNLYEGAMPGFVYLPLGFGHTAYDEFSKGKGANPNNIIQAGKDPLSGHPVWWNTPVKLIKV